MIEHHYNGPVDVDAIKAGTLCTKCERPPWAHSLGFVYYLSEADREGVLHFVPRTAPWPNDVLDFMRCHWDENKRKEP